MHIECMSTKTISLKREAYDRLRGARRYPEESFSEVVMRATWPEDSLTARELLFLLKHGRAKLPKRLLDRVAALKRADVPPENKWADR
jgi:hypothetical protein